MTGKVLIAGATGFMDRRVCRHPFNQGFSIIALARTDSEAALITPLVDQFPAGESSRNGSRGFRLI